MIPKIIHYCWFGDKDIPEKDKENIRGWMKLHPDFTFMFWNETNYDFSNNKYTSEAYKSRKLGFVPDFIRIDVVYKYGGFYFDTDVELLKRIDFLCQEHCFFGFEDKKTINQGQGFGAEKGNPFLKKMLDMYNNLSFINNDGSLNTTASPVYLSSMLSKEGFKLNGKEQVISGIHLFPKDFFCPKDYLTNEIKVTKNTVSIHHFNLSWVSDEERIKMKKIGNLKRILGLRLAYNIVDFQYNIKKGGVIYAQKILFQKIKRKIKKK